MQAKPTLLFLLFCFTLLDTFSQVSESELSIEELQLPCIFGDHMVIQQKDSIAFFGKAVSGQKVLVETLWGEVDSTVANRSGDWKVSVLTPSASFDPQTIQVSTNTDTVVLKDVLVGEVWLCSGQSNMGFRMKKEKHASEEIPQANKVPIRLFNVHYDASESPLGDFQKEVSWKNCDSVSVREFSAVGYYFGKMLSSQMPEVPIGLINASYGGATAEAFMRKEALLSKTLLAKHYHNYKNKEKPSKNPTYCYNAIIHPLIDYKIKGVAWYQGESNCIRASQYKQTLKKLINSWRDDFDNPNLPFYVVQLPAYRYRDFQQEPDNSFSAATLRDAQLSVSQELDNVGLVVTLDVGEINNIHPTNKKPVGERLAKQVLNDCYGLAHFPSSGPVYKNHRIEGNTIRLSFDYTFNDIKDTDSELSWFTIAGEDRRFYHGNAFVDSNEVVVSSPFVEMPKAVRYAWHNEAMPNFFNQEGLLASPFKTDSWEDLSYTHGITSWSVFPDIRNVPFDLVVPELTAGAPAAGKRVKQTLATYKGTNVYHTLYLPINWEAGKEYPVIVEYAGNGPFVSKYGDVNSGRVEESYLGYGLSGGEDFIWVGMPFISNDGQENQLNWWGDVESSVNYTINVVNDICEKYGGDSKKVIVTGFSRGAIACNYIGLHNDQIANLWTGAIPFSHYDGVRKWSYPDSDEASALTRLNRLNEIPQLIIQENGGPAATKAYIEKTGVAGDFTYLTIPYRNHDTRWVLQKIPEREVLRDWVRGLVNRQ